MKVINATWERRNLGLDTIEIQLEATDDLALLKEVVTTTEAEYIVLKIGSGCTDHLLAAQDMGFYLLETSIALEASLNTMQLPRIYARFEDKVEVMPADGSLAEQVLDLIRTGEVFQTDRIAVDPAFSPLIAGRRYANWIGDLLRRGEKINICLYKGKLGAFAIGTLKDNGIYDAILGGVFSEMANKGLGFLAIYANLRNAQRLGAKKYVTHVSSNNLPILRLHQLFGCAVNNIEYVLIMHKEKVS